MQTLPQSGVSPRKALIVALGLAAITAAVYLPALRGGFVWDDADYVSANLHIRELSLATLAWAAQSSYAGNWHPLTWISHAVNVAVFGLDPFGHHAVSVALHALNAALLLLLLARMTGQLGRSLAVALLFALHPLRVESVAWIAERKDVLSTCFFLLTLHLYVGYTRRPSPARYFAALCLFAAGLSAKPMLVTLPAVLLLLDDWPLRRLSRRVLFEKVPFFLLAAVSTALTFWAQSLHGAVSSTDAVPVAARLTNAVVCYARYLWHAVWPVALAPYYPYPGKTGAPHPGWALPVAGLTLIAITCGVVLLRERRYLTVGWAFYLGTLIPVIGLVQVGRQAMADRYTYIPLIGIFLAGVWGIDEFIETRRRLDRRVVVALGLLVCALLAFRTVRQIAIWHDSETLWRHALVEAPRSPEAHFNLAHALYRRGALDEAVLQFREAGRSEDPSAQASAHARIGSIRREQRRLDEALAELVAAVRLRPDSAEFHERYANALTDAGRLAEAEAAYRKALALGGPAEQRSDLLRNFAVLLVAAGRAPEAVEQARRAVELAPKAANYEALAFALSKAQRLPEAVAALELAVARDPQDSSLRERLDWLRGQTENR